MCGRIEQGSNIDREPRAEERERWGKREIEKQGLIDYFSSNHRLDKLQTSMMCLCSPQSMSNPVEVMWCTDNYQAPPQVFSLHVLLIEKEEREQREREGEPH